MNRARFIASLRRPGIFKLLVRLLSNSPSLRRLSIGLIVEVLANYDCYFDDLNESDEERDCKMMRAANERGADTFVDNEILNPLQNLSNVEWFEFSFIGLSAPPPPPPPPPPLTSLLTNLLTSLQQLWKGPSRMLLHRWSTCR